ncbi:MAG: hypothetical protein ABSE51_18140 [Terracidiphilus sp.]|jgi:hypothetical protein
MIAVQMSFVFNTAAILFGWWIKKVPELRMAHYFIYEIATVVGVYCVYRKILQNRARLFESLQKINVGTFTVVLLVYNISMSLVMFKFAVGIGGSSRIGFMTTGWFSYVRPFMFIFDPLGYLFSIYLFDRGNRCLALSVLAPIVFSDILSGSKASFIVAILISLLVYQDLKGAKLVMPKTLKLIFVITLVLAAMFTLDRLHVSMSAMADRFVLTGESTIEVYYSNDPSAASSGVSTVAKIHRGVAKILGDRSANDPDTLFGFALNRLEYGVNTLTGPNATIPSYMLCNYSGWENLIGFASIFGYLAIVTWFYELFIYRRRQATSQIVFFPFVVSALYKFPQEYNFGMSSITLICMFTLAFVWISVAITASQGAKSAYDTA